jgi:hypothetical protein
MIDPSDPFFAPLWRRIAIVGLCLGWSLVEVLSGSPGWALIFGAAGAYAAFKLLGPGYRSADANKEKDDG